MFFLGLLLGVLLMLLVGAVLWLCFRLSAPPDLTLLDLYQSKADIRAAERRTIHDLLHAELAAQRASRPTGTDIIEGTATDLEAS